MKLSRRLAAAMLVLALSICAVVRAQVLDQVPEQALVVIKVSNLQGFSTKFGKFATDLQLVAQVPQLADPLGALTDHLKIKAGLDKAGEAAFAYFDPAIAGGNEDQSMLLLIPVSDYKAFVGNFEGAKEDAGITEVKFPENDDPVYLASWGKYAVMTPSKEIAALKPAGIKVEGATAKEMASKDVIVFANMAQLREKARPELAKTKDEAIDNATSELTGDKEKWVPVAKAAMNQFFALADGYLRDATSASIGLNLTDAGISTTTMTEFMPASYMGTALKGLKNSEGSMLTGLPGGKYLFYGGFVNDSQTLGKLVDDLVNPVVAELNKVEGPESQAANKYVTAMRKVITSMKSETFGLVAPTGALGQEPIIQMIAIATGDPAAMKAASKDMMDAQQQFMTAMGGAQDAIKITVTPDAKTLEGVSFELTHTEISMGQGANAAQADNAMKMIYGPEGMNALAGVMGDKLIIGFCASDATLSGAVTTTKTNDDPLAKIPGVATVSAQLPKTRVMTLYVPLDEIVSTIGTYVGAMGMPIQIQLPPDLPPIGITVASEGSALRIDSFTSTDLIKALVAQGMQLYMQRMGGGQPGGPGGL